MSISTPAFLNNLRKATGFWYCSTSAPPRLRWRSVEGLAVMQLEFLTTKMGVLGWKIGRELNAGIMGEMEGERSGWVGGRRRKKHGGGGGGSIEKL